MLKGRPTEKIEKIEKIERDLDQALADTFPASDPVAVLQPTTVGLEESPASKTKKNGDLKSPSVPRAAA